MVVVLNPIQIGVDIGKVTDPTALSVAEVVRVNTGRFRSCKRVPAHLDRRGQFVPAKDAEPVLRTRWIVRQIGRLKLGTDYPEVAIKIVDMLLSDRFEGRKIRMLIDVTGVGQAIFDMVKKELYERIHGVIRVYKEDSDHQLAPKPVVSNLTAEQKERLKNVSLQPIGFVHGQKYDRKHGTLGKDILVSKMQARLQYGDVDMPDTAEAKATCEELKVYETRINDKGNAQHGAFQTGAHDDLATALGLSCLEDPYSDKVTYSERIH